MRLGKRSALLFLLLSLLISGCGSRMDLTRSTTQMSVGVRAAQSNLWREALFRFERAVQIDPANAMAQNNLAVAYEGIGEFDKAKTAYVEALRLDRSNEHIQKNYSRFVEFSTRNKQREEAAVASPAAAPAATGSGSTAPSPGAPPQNPAPGPPASAQPQPAGIPATPPSSPSPVPDPPGGIQ